MKAIKDSPKFIELFDNEKIITLAIFLGIEKTDIEEINEAKFDTLEYKKEKFLVLSYDENNRDYERLIDDAEYRDDYKTYNIRAQAVSDRAESRVNVNGTYYYIYRIE